MGWKDRFEPYRNYSDGCHYTDEMEVEYTTDLQVQEGFG